ncbi:MAG: hypothetical protein CL760_11285 [Chloroflexi bacterium]|nr:hypothetical protein [Chloroflexota bacterium]|tara:strand:- start:36493 stop:37113 length:621 start_codon:yes stop_codon:yes gene_type:complete
MEIKKPEVVKKKISWKEWIVPLSEENMTVREALETQAQSGAAEQVKIPLIVKLVENPKYDIPYITLFDGAVGLTEHDIIHLLLGRGMLPKDEAFIIGFTMGSSNSMSTFQKKIYGLISKYAYPKYYKFDDEDIEVFKKAAHLGYVSNCQPLNTIDFESLMDLSLKEAREKVGIEVDLINAYYKAERQKYPNDNASQRSYQKQLKDL